MKRDKTSKTWRRGSACLNIPLSRQISDSYSFQTILVISILAISYLSLLESGSFTGALSNEIRVFSIPIADCEPPYPIVSGFIYDNRACGNFQAVSEGKSMYGCGSFDPRKAQTLGLKIFEMLSIPAPAGYTHPIHDYLCGDDPLKRERTIIECSGDDVRGPINANKNISDVKTGYRAVAGEGEDTHYIYCSRDGHWVTDLDGSDSASCIGSNLNWTGSRCCGEHKDPGEFYDDPKNHASDMGGGICFNSTAIADGTRIFGDQLLVVKGQAYSCALSGRDQGLLTINISGTASAMIKDRPLCESFFDVDGMGKSVFCSSEGRWKDNPSRDDLFLSIPPEYIRIPGGRGFGCCRIGDCWDGLRCIANQRDAVAGTEGWRCVDGNWSYQKMKKTPSGDALGICPRQDQCLFYPAGNPANNDHPQRFYSQEKKEWPVCISDGQSAGDWYCGDGNWTTRTVILSRYLLDFALENSPDNYSIYCDDFESVLNFYDGNPESNRSLIDYIGEGCSPGGGNPCVNQFCLLKTDVSAGIALSLNLPINDSRKGFLSALGKDPGYCSQPGVSQDTFHQCGEGIHYYPKINSVVYLLSGVLGNKSLDEVFLSTNQFISERFHKISEFANNSRPGTSDLCGSINAHAAFDKAYFGSDKGIELFASMRKSSLIGSSPLDSIALYYRGLNRTKQSVCGMISYGPSFIDSVCAFKKGDLLFAGIAPAGNDETDSAWSDLTREIRI